MKVIDSRSGEEHYYKLGRQLFIVAQSSLGKSIALIIDTLKSEQVLGFVQEAKDILKEEKLVFKLIGMPNLVNSVSKIVESFSLDVKRVFRSEDFEVFFYPTNGKVRVSKDLSANKPEPIIKKDIKVMVVDDSKTIRNLLTKVIEGTEGMKVVATAEKPSQVEDLIKEHNPDVITLDIHMPEMTGVELLKVIGPKYNIPTIMVTSISIEEGPLVLEALENGAFDYIQKPEISEIKQVGELLVEKIKEASQTKAKIGKINKLGAKPIQAFNQDSLIVMGSSTGGTNALKDILTKMPAQIPPILIVQHIPPVFSKAFADRMNALCPFNVREAKQGDVVEKNTVLVAPGGQQMKVVNKGGIYYIEITDDAPVNRFKPSVDYLFNSTVPVTKRKHVVSCILTGMGRDGAKGMLDLKKSGSYTIAQDEESSVVFGMPKEAIALGAAMAIEHKDDIASKLAEFSWPKEDDNEKAS